MKNYEIEKSILKAICDKYSPELTYTEAKEALNDLAENLKSDFYFEFDGMEFRVIDDSYIWRIYVETITSIVSDCYELNIPSFVEIDWESTANNCFADRYGPTFSGYDGSELEAFTSDSHYWIFRNN